jgi:hypothetical protein
MAQKSATHPHLTFAQRHSKSILSTLNAFGALCRLDNLLADLDELQAAIKAYEAAGNSRGRRLFWFEITSYYPVGFVTCLEWHARSRLVDLLTFLPSAVRPDDLKGQINDKLMVQSVAEGITVPQLMGAMTNVGSSEKYIGVFERLFSDLKISQSIRDVVNPIIFRSDHEGKTFDALQKIFDYRNRIVHEIDYSSIGPWLVRDSIEVGEARDMGALVHNVIAAIEITLSQSAPKGFPNRLDSTLTPEDALDYLDREITKLEAEITAAIRDYRTATGPNADLDDWLSALAASQNSQKIELDFISDADFMFNRHADFKTPLKTELRRQRLAYLKRLKAEIV